MSRGPESPNSESTKAQIVVFDAFVVFVGKKQLYRKTTALTLNKSK